MKVIFTCGGTAGHVNPALALAGYMREKDASTQILFVGAERGLERDLIAHTDYPFRTVNISSFHRSFRPAEIKHNLVSLKNLAHAEREANAILNDFKPDLIVGTGGYAKAGIPTAVHESNIVPGLTTRQLEPHCDRIMVGFEDCRAHYKHPEKVVVTGTPVRGDFFTISKQQAKERLGMNDGRKLIVSFWGSRSFWHSRAQRSLFTISTASARSAGSRCSSGCTMTGWRSLSIPRSTCASTSTTWRLSCAPPTSLSAARARLRSAS